MVYFIGAIVEARKDTLLDKDKIGQIVDIKYNEIGELIFGIKWATKKPSIDSDHIVYVHKSYIRPWQGAFNV